MIASKVLDMGDGRVWTWGFYFLRFDAWNLMLFLTFNFIFIIIIIIIIIICLLASH